MKKLLLTLSLIGTGAIAAYSQNYMTRTGKINFDATSKSSPEKIAAVNNEAAVVFDAKTGRIIFQVLVKGFKFEKELMEEHFNENYMESDKFPKSDFNGSITNLSEINLAKDGTYPVKVKGKLQIHGETREVEQSGEVIVKGNTLTFKAKFAIKMADYKITVPQLVADKVSKEATISLESDLVRK